MKQMVPTGSFSWKFPGIGAGVLLYGIFQADGSWLTVAILPSCNMRQVLLSYMVPETRNDSLPIIKHRSSFTANGFLGSFIKKVYDKRLMTF